MDRLRFEYGAAMISNVRIAVGAPDMRSNITEGKLVTYGIYFDVMMLKPESYGTLKKLQVLTENPDVKVKIIGHTDADGDDNQPGSFKRGASVFLVNT
jgi:outer membrane protein OmpA-like peptidoglycan-associated protein